MKTLAFCIGIMAIAGCANDIDGKDGSGNLTSCADVADAVSDAIRQCGASADPATAVSCPGVANATACVFAINEAPCGYFDTGPGLERITKAEQEWHERLRAACGSN